MSRRRYQALDRFRRPEVYLAELLNRSVRGEFVGVDEQPVIFRRALVVAVDVLGGMLENPDASGIVEHVIDGKTVSYPALNGPRNPANSVKARIISEEEDQFLGDDDLAVYWPLMPEHDQVPVKPGEHVYVTFEDADRQHGLWFGKVPGHEGVNFARGESFFTTRDSRPLTNLFVGTDTSSDDDLATDRVASGRLVGGDLGKAFGVS